MPTAAVLLLLGLIFPGWQSPSSWVASQSQQPLCRSLAYHCQRAEQQSHLRALIQQDLLVAEQLSHLRVMIQPPLLWADQQSHLHALIQENLGPAFQEAVAAKQLGKGHERQRLLRQPRCPLDPDFGPTVFQKALPH